MALEGLKAGMTSTLNTASERAQANWQTHKRAIVLSGLTVAAGVALAILGGAGVLSASTGFLTIGVTAAAVGSGLLGYNLLGKPLADRVVPYAMLNPGAAPQQPAAQQAPLISEEDRTVQAPDPQPQVTQQKEAESAAEAAAAAQERKAEQQQEQNKQEAGVNGENAKEMRSTEPTPAKKAASSQSAAPRSSWKAPALAIAGVAVAGGIAYAGYTGHLPSAAQIQEFGQSLYAQIPSRAQVSATIASAYEQLPSRHNITETASSLFSKLPSAHAVGDRVTQALGDDPASIHNGTCTDTTLRSFVGHTYSAISTLGSKVSDMFTMLSQPTGSSSLSRPLVYSPFSTLAYKV